MMVFKRDYCKGLDARDPLAEMRGEFALPDGVIYLDGNSLGALPRGAAKRLAQVATEEWGDGLIRSWNSHDWISMPRRVGATIARLIGAADDEVIAADSTSVNLFKLVSAALRLRPGRATILSERSNFPTDVYMLEGLIDQPGSRHSLRLEPPGDVIDAIDDSVAIVVLSHVNYKTGRIHDMAGITRAAHDRGALVLWDLCHSAGAMPVNLNRCGVDFAVGCGYKFLNGGPGAPAFLYVAKSLQADIRQPLTGWLGHAAPFAFEDHYRPADGIERNLCGTPAVLGLAALEIGVNLFDRVDMTTLRHKSQEMGDLFIALVDQQCRGFGLEIACPEDRAQRGSQVSLRHREGYAIMQALIARGVIGDFRAPDILRFGITPLYLRYTDIWDAVSILRDIMAGGIWDRPEYRERQAVT
ncbi:MAG: kynureninase [Sphingomonadales bacterium]